MVQGTELESLRIIFGEAVVQTSNNGVFEVCQNICECALCKEEWLDSLGCALI